jgi:hypothetical protein
MKTRNLHPRLFTLTFTCLLPLLALASTACGAAPGSQGDEPAPSASASPVEDGTDAGTTAQAQGEPDPTGVVDPGGVQPTAPSRPSALRADQLPTH